MNENITALIKKIAESEDLQAKFAALGSPDEAFELAKTIQEGFTKEEFLEATRLLATADEDISDEELASAAGGMDVADRELTIEVPNLTDKSASILSVATRTIRTEIGKASKAMAV